MTDMVVDTPKTILNEIQNEFQNDFNRITPMKSPEINREDAYGTESCIGRIENENNIPDIVQSCSTTKKPELNTSLDDTTTDINDRFSKRQIEDLKLNAKHCHPTIPALMTIEQLQIICTKLKINTDFDNLKMRSRKRKTTIEDSCPKKKKVKNGHYEVEAILGTSDTEDGSLIYFVKWKGWDDEFNSWEPIKHLVGCTELLREYRNNTKQGSEPEDYLKMTKFKCAINKITHKSYEDPTLIMKLCQEPINKVSNTKLKELKKRIRESSTILTLDTGGKYGNLSKIINSDVKRLKIDEIFGSLDNFITFIEERKRILPIFKKWENEINEKISAEKEGVPIIVENIVDLEQPPKDFVYITKSKTTADQAPNGSGLLWCECENCFDNRENCCPKNMDSVYVYNNEGLFIKPRARSIIECNKNCKCPITCSNRVIQRGRQFKLAVFRTDNGCGWGVKTTEKIPKGSFIMEYVGEVLPSAVADERGQAYDAEGQTYLYDLDFNDNLDCKYTIDAKQYGNISHFVNHSCDPNLESYVAWIDHVDPDLPRIVFFSRRNIRAGEELTFNYRMMMPSQNSMDDSPTNEKDFDFSVIADEEKLFNGIDFGPSCNSPSTSGFTLDKAIPVMLPAAGDPDPDTLPQNNHVGDYVQKKNLRIACRCGTRNCNGFLLEES